MEKQPTNHEYTARDAAKDFIRPYVLRGDSVESLRRGAMGHWGQDYRASIGGTIVREYPGGGMRVRGIGTDKVLVHEVAGQPVVPPAIYTLSELYDEVRRENDPNEYAQRRLL